MQSEPLASALFGRWFDLSTEAIFAVDRESGVVVCANRALGALLRCTPSAIVGTLARQWLVDPQEWDPCSAKLAYREHLGFRATDGAVVYLSLSLTEAGLDQRALIACVGRDTTSHRAAERERTARTSELHAAHGGLSQLVAELSAAKLELEDRNREIAVLAGQVSRFGWRAAVGELVAGIAHHLNNPVGALTSTLRRLEVALRELPSGAQREALEALVRRGREITRRIELNVGAVVRTHVAGAAEPSRQALSLHNEIETALAMVADRLHKVVVIRDYEESPPVLAPHDSLHLVLSNLLDNSLRAMPQHGVLTFIIRRRGDEVVLRIADNGSGVPIQLRQHLFEPILSAREGGTGLGLSTAQRLARAWGGRIVHVPTPVGAAFEISIPTSCAARSEPNAHAPAPDPHAGTPITQAALASAPEPQEKHV